jgi:hypothetical protein
MAFPLCVTAAFLSVTGTDGRYLHCVCVCVCVCVHTHASVCSIVLITNLNGTEGHLYKTEDK